MNTELTPFEALQTAIKRAGTQEILAQICGCSQQAISKMLTAKRMSHTYVIAAETATGVSRHDLRPDIYPRPQLEEAPQNRRADDEALTPWETGDYGNFDLFLDQSAGAPH